MPGGVGKITVWDTSDLASPVYLKTVTPRVGSTGEYRGVVVYKGSTSTIDGDVYFSNVETRESTSTRPPTSRSRVRSR
jgi:hypothetical protein